MRGAYLFSTISSIYLYHSNSAAAIVINVAIAVVAAELSSLFLHNI